MKVEDVIDILKTAYKKKNIVVKLDDILFEDGERLPTGSLSLDRALNGGIKRGVLVELYGSPSAGKSTLSLHIISEAQKVGKVLYIDAECSFDRHYAERLGVDIKELLFSQPDYAEQAFEIVEAMVKSDEISLIVVDSVAALSTKVEMEGDSGDANMGVNAKLLGQHLRKVIRSAVENKIIVVYINQIRQNLSKYGAFEIRPGGLGLKHFTSIEIRLSRIGYIKKDDTTIGIRAKAQITKNKTGIPYLEAEFEIKNGNGIDFFGELLEQAEKLNVVTKKGSWYYCGETKLKQGKENTINFLAENIELQNKIKELI